MVCFTLLIAGGFFSCSNHLKLKETKRIIRDLSDDELKGRDTGSEGYELAARYVENYLDRAGYQPLFKSYRDSGEFRGMSCFNVVAINQAYDANQRTVVIGAHLDHVGLGKPYQSDSIYNGANDNATGVAAVLQIGHYLNRTNHEENIILAFFTAEEKGLLGSQHLADRMAKEGFEPDMMINFDMIGAVLTGKPGKVYLTGYDFSDMAAKMNDELNKEFVTYLPTAAMHNVFQRSDNYPFYQTFHIPAHTFITFDFTNYPQYHHVDDEWKQVHFKNTNKIIKRSAKAIDQLLIKDMKISLKK